MVLIISVLCFVSADGPGEKWGPSALLVLAILPALDTYETLLLVLIKRAGLVEQGKHLSVAA